MGKFQYEKEKIIKFQSKKLNQFWNELLKMYGLLKEPKGISKKSNHTTNVIISLFQREYPKYEGEGLLKILLLK